MNKRLKWVFRGSCFCIAIAAVSVYRWTPEQTQAAETQASAPADSNEPIHPIAVRTGLNPLKVELGRALFNDPRLSHNDRVSCAGCHDLTRGGSDHKRNSIGIYGQAGVVNAPTVLNSGLNFSQFWDGRAATLEEQCNFPIESKTEMGSNWPEAVGKLMSSADYVRAFRRIYGDKIRAEHVRDSIAEFERSLSTPNSRFDRYLDHKADVLTRREIQGYKLFKAFGCASCHQGENVGGNMYQKMGVMVPYFTDASKIREADRGRFNVTKNPDDLYMFKVPSLRNVALTAPYLHDGSAATLGDAVRMMAKHQVSRPITNQESDLIVEFLKTLTGELNGKPL